MAPEQKILGVISKEDQMAEIQRRLQDKETQKARKLLALATGSHYEALNITKDLILKQIMNVKNGNGTGRK
jgi:hypothetical protein